MSYSSDTIKLRIKSALKDIPALGPLALWAHCRLLGGAKTDPGCWLGHILDQAEAQVVQIGSNDGRTGDPVYMLIKKNKRWRALFVEPVPHLFERLKANYGSDPRFAFENSVVTDQGDATFYWVDRAAETGIPGLPSWYDQLGSFDRSHILKHFDGALEPYIVKASIRGLTLPQLFAKHGIVSVDLLHIDTEGHDWRVLSQLQLDTLCPRVILYEEAHLTDEEKRLAIAFLEPSHHLFSIGIDVLALLRGGGFSQQLLAGLQPMAISAC